MSKAIITVPVPDGHTSQRYFEFDLQEYDVLTLDSGALVVWAADGSRHQEFAPGHWSRLEFPRG